MKTCSVDDCDKPFVAKGYCKKHYTRFQKHGDPSINAQTPRMLGDTGEITTKRSPTCSVEGCVKQHSVRGWCHMHYARWQRHGSPDGGVDKSEGFREIVRAYLDQDWTSVLGQLGARVDFVQLDGIDTPCREWKHTRTSKGYPRITARIDGKFYNFGVHRISLEASLARALHPKMQAHHQCSNPICINPEHLEESTAVKNTAEMKARRFFLARIAELEEALRELDPHHVLLG